MKYHGNFFSQFKINITTPVCWASIFSCYIKAFENGILPLLKRPQGWSETQTDKKSDKKERAKNDVKKFSDSIIYKEMGINRKLFREYFNFQHLVLC